MYQNKLIGVVGGVSGRLMLKFHHNYAGFSAHILSNADNSAHMLKIQQHQYHKLKNCRHRTHLFLFRVFNIILQFSTICQNSNKPKTHFTQETQPKFARPKTTMNSLAQRPTPPPISHVTLTDARWKGHQWLP